MKSNTSSFSTLARRGLSLALAAGCLCLPARLVAAGFTVSPSPITNNFTGNIAVLINNIPSGATVRLEEFLDLNNNGVVDSTDLLVDSFEVTDGQAISFGGVRDISIPGDLDAVAGQITTSVNFPNKPEVTYVAGAHLYRLSSPSAAFTSVVLPVVVAQPVYPQGVSGLVTNGAAVVAEALVGLLAAAGGNPQVVAATLTDATGHYALKAPAGTYYMFCFKSGYVAPFGSPPVAVLSNLVATQNLAMTVGTRTISGTITDAGTSTGLPALQLLAQSTTTNMASLATSDANGNFSFTVAPDKYKLSISPRSLQQLGYLQPATKLKVDVTSANATGVSVGLPRANAMIYGSLTTDAHLPIAGVSISTGDASALYDSTALTDTNGNYAVGVLGGTNWYIGPDTSSPLLQGDNVSGTNLYVGANQALPVNFVASRFTAHILGRVVDNTGAGQPGLTIDANPATGPFNSTTTAADGSFDLGVTGGNWQLSLDTNSIAGHNWQIPVLDIPVTDGVDVTNISYLVLNTTSAITGWVRDITGAGLANIRLTAGVNLGGTNYSQTVASDASGNYSLGAVNGQFQVWVDDCAGVPQAQANYGCPTNNYQFVSITGPGVVVDFTLLPPLQLSFYVRHFTYGGDFGNGLTPVTHFPVAIKGYAATLDVQYGDPFPPLGNIIFTGPPGSGLTNTPASKIGIGTNFENYISPDVFNPTIAPAGTWTVSYNGTPTNYTLADPQAAARLFAPVPTVTIAGGNLTSVSWVLKDASGNLLTAVPAYVTKFQVLTFDQDLNALDTSASMSPATTQYTFGTPLAWSGVRRVSIAYFDTLGNRFYLNCDRATPNLALAQRLNGQFQFLANGLASQKYTVEYSTTLTNWFILYATNAPVGTFNVLDPAATDAQRFYRVWVSE